MSKRSDFDFLMDILEAAKRIQDYCRQLDFEDFMRDKKTQDAVVRNLEVIGEAAKNLSSEFIDRYPRLPWSDFARVRDKLIHHYFGVNLDIVWSIAENSLPDFIEQAKKIKD